MNELCTKTLWQGITVCYRHWNCRIQYFFPSLSLLVTDIYHLIPPTSNIIQCLSLYSATSMKNSQWPYYIGFCSQKRIMKFFQLHLSEMELDLNISSKKLFETISLRQPDRMVTTWNKIISSISSRSFTFWAKIQSKLIFLSICFGTIKQSISLVLGSI